jgi:hypothetical protein
LQIFSPLSISYSTGKFRRKWRLMVKMRRSFNDAIRPHICYTSYSYIPRVSPPPSIAILSPIENASPLDSSPLVYFPPPVLLVFPPPPHYRKRKHRKRRRRRWNLFRKYFRPSDTASIEKVQLIQTMIPDKLVNRSFGSLNARDPPD